MEEAEEAEAEEEEDEEEEKRAIQAGSLLNDCWDARFKLKTCKKAADGRRLAQLSSFPV